MSVFNTSDLINELNTIVSGLDLPNESETRLISLLKALENLGQQVSSEILDEIRSRIENINDEVLTEKFFLLTMMLNFSVDDRQIVISVDDLPPASSLPSGTAFFVTEIQILVVNSGFFWLGFDGRRLRYDGPLAKVAMAWGENSVGQIGNETTTRFSSPVTVAGGISNWSQMSAGRYHSLGITHDGIALAWGINIFGLLGDSTTNDRSSPVTVVGGITNWKQVSAGSFHNLGVTDDGIAYGWGFNGQGRLGDDTTTARSSPVTVVGEITNWRQISSGEVHSVGVTDDGTALAWGNNIDGQLGDDSTTNRSSPVTVVGEITNWKQVSAGTDHSLGVTADGIALAWGRNFNGQLGDDLTTSRSSPVTVVGGITNWRQVNAGNRHSLGITDNGVAFAWGSNSYGRLGDDSTTARSSPVTVVGGITNWRQVSAGGYHSVGVTDDGIALAWGRNFNGQLGDGTIINYSSPITVVGGISNWSQVSAGRYHSLGVQLSIPS